MDDCPPVTLKIAPILIFSAAQEPAVMKISARNRHKKTKANFFMGLPLFALDRDLLPPICP